VEISDSDVEMDEDGDDKENGQANNSKKAAGE
jgi:hypothetical protein